jgi:hypothetical protein
MSLPGQKKCNCKPFYPHRFIAIPSRWNGFYPVVSAVVTRLLSATSNKGEPAAKPNSLRDFILARMKMLALIAVAVFPLIFAVGGAQKYAEDIKAFTTKHGAPPHPLQPRYISAACLSFQRNHAPSLLPSPRTSSQTV